MIDNGEIDVVAGGVGDAFADENWISVPIGAASTIRTRNKIVTSSLLPKRDAKIIEGPKNVPEGTRNPSEYMDLFFTQEILETFVLSTNSYNHRLAKPHWVQKNDLTVPELKKYFAVIMYMAMNKMNNGQLANQQPHTQ